MLGERALAVPGEEFPAIAVPLATAAWTWGSLPGLSPAKGYRGLDLGEPALPVPGEMFPRLPFRWLPRPALSPPQG